MKNYDNYMNTVIIANRNLFEKEMNFAEEALEIMDNLLESNRQHVLAIKKSQQDFDFVFNEEKRQILQLMPEEEAFDLVLKCFSLPEEWTRDLLSGKLAQEREVREEAIEVLEAYYKRINRSYPESEELKEMRMKISL